MTSKADSGLPLTRELFEQLRAKITSLQAENDTLREENTTLQNTNARQAHLLQVQGETKKNSSLVSSSSKKARFAYISQIIIPQFQPSVDPDDIPYEQIAWWKDIFSYIQPNDYERLHLRRLCNMFKTSLKAPPKGIFTEFPHPNHASIDSLFNRCKELHDEDPTKAPTIIFIKEGEHEVEGYQSDMFDVLIHVPAYPQENVNRRINN